MPRGNLDNFGKKKAHAFGSKERESEKTVPEQEKKKFPPRNKAHGSATPKPKSFNPKKDFVRNSQGDYDRVKAPKQGQVNKPAPKKDEYKPLGQPHGMQMGTGGYGMAHGTSKLGSSSYGDGDKGGSYGDYEHGCGDEM